MVKKTLGMSEKVCERRSIRVANHGGGALQPTHPAEPPNTGDNQAAELKSRRARRNELGIFLEGRDFAAPPDRPRFWDLRCSQRHEHSDIEHQGQSHLPQACTMLETPMGTTASTPAQESAAVQAIHRLVEVRSPLSTTTTRAPTNVMTSFPSSHSPLTTMNEFSDLPAPPHTDLSSNLGMKRHRKSPVGFRQRLLRIVFRGVCVALAYIYLGVWHLLFFQDRFLVWLRKPKSAVGAAVLYAVFAACTVLFAAYIVSTGSLCSGLF